MTFAMRGGPGNEGRLTVDGLSLGASLNGTGVSYTVADVGNAQEVVFSTAGSLGEAENAGPAMNLVPRQGGNRFSGTFFANGANDSMQSDNFSEEIRAAGLRAPNKLAKIWDTSAAIGGPIRRIACGSSRRHAIRATTGWLVGCSGISTPATPTPGRTRRT